MNKTRLLLFTVTVAITASIPWSRLLTRAETTGNADRSQAERPAPRESAARPTPGGNPGPRPHGHPEAVEVSRTVQPAPFPSSLDDFDQVVGEQPEWDSEGQRERQRAALMDAARELHRMYGTTWVELDCAFYPCVLAISDAYDLTGDDFRQVWPGGHRFSRIDYPTADGGYVTILMDRPADVPQQHGPSFSRALEMADFYHVNGLD